MLARPAKGFADVKKFFKNMGGDVKGKKNVVI